ncbi:efflux RND transporter periplasmic adaptor subunit [Patescibacteria group bacterium]
MKRQSKTILTIVIIFAIAVAGVGGYLYYRDGGAGTSISDMESITIKTDDIERKIFADGEIMSESTEKIVAPYSGSVKEILVEENAKVQEDDDLVIIETITGEETITAGQSGTVVNLFVDEGDIVGQGQSQIVQVVDLNNLIIEANVSESEIVDIDKGQPVDIEFTALDDVMADGKVTFVALAPEESLDGRTSYIVRVSIDDQPKDVLVGMTANLEVLVEKKEDVLVIDNSYLYTKNGSTLAKKVITSADGKEELLEVVLETGIEGNKKTEVISGLEEGDTVVLPSDADAGIDDDAPALFGPNS